MDPTQLDYSATDITQPKDSVRATRRLIPAGKALVIGIVALLTATLLNASALLASAEAQNVGSPLRAITVSVMRPVASLSTALRLDVPRRVVDQALGRSALESDSATVAASPVAPAASTTTTTTTTTAPSGPRPVSPEEPLRVYLAADSFGQTLGPSLVNLTSDEGLVEVEYDFEISSGLMRPDFYDWPAHVQERLPEIAPEVTIAMFGGNDGQETFAEGALQDIGSPVWIDVYAGRVGEMMDILSAGSEYVYWVGLPISGSAEHTEKFQMMNEIYRAEAAKRPNVTFVDIWALFQDESGQYSTYLRNDGGDLVVMRAADNIHFEWPGAERLAAELVARLAAGGLLTTSAD